jgi:hypothetical protein
MNKQFYLLFSDTIIPQTVSAKLRDWKVPTLSAESNAVKNQKGQTLPAESVVMIIFVRSRKWSNLAVMNKNSSVTQTFYAMKGGSHG